CQCTLCIPTQQVQTSYCCKEQQKITRRIQQFIEKNPEEQIFCITLHPGFQSVCLDRYVLDTVYYQYRQEHGNFNHDGENEKYRYTAYRQFVRWCWEWLGRRVRVPLPSCVLSKIRGTYPSPNGQYRDFLYA
ncbi:hypothetical protein QZH41_017496, partial [Actinostola sp. cb2023]